MPPLAGDAGDADPDSHEAPITVRTRWPLRAGRRLAVPLPGAALPVVLAAWAAYAPPARGAGAGPPAEAGSVVAGGPRISSISTRPYLPRDSTSPEVRSIVFPGAHALDRSQLKAAIATKATRCKSVLFTPVCLLGLGIAQRHEYLDRAELPRDVERLETLYEAWGYPDAEVTARVVPPDGRAVSVRFDIDEGAPIVVDSVAVIRLDTLQPPVSLPRRLPLSAGDPYALPRLQATETAVRSAYAERGHPGASVEIGGSLDEAARRATVVLRVSPGPAAVFGPVRVRTEPPISEKVVRGQLEFAPGEPYRASALDDSEARLYAMPIVERAVVHAPAVPGDSVVAVDVAVASRPRTGTALQGTLSSTDCLELTAAWQDRWFLGAPRIFTMGVGVSNVLAGPLGGSFPCSSTGEGIYARPNYFARAGLVEPLAGASATTLMLSGYYSRQSAPGAFVQRGWGAQVGVGRRLAPGLHGSIAYTFERDRLDAAEIYYCGNYGVCDAPSIDRLEGPSRFAPLGLLATWDRPARPAPLRRDKLPPWALRAEPWRFHASGGVEAAGPALGSTYRFERVLLEGVAKRALGETGSGEIAARVRWGGLFARGDVVPPQARIYSGGPSTVRGAAQNLLGPLVLLATSEDATAIGCDTAAATCPADAAADPRTAIVRAIGGERLLEANVEARWFARPKLELAAFVDYGRLGPGPSPAALPGIDAAQMVSPGVGLRIMSDMGPIRVDVAYDATGPRRLPLVVSGRDGVTPFGTVLYRPFAYGNAGGFHRFLRRLQLQVAVGEAF